MDNGRNNLNECRYVRKWKRRIWIDIFFEYVYISYILRSTVGKFINIKRAFVF